MIDPGTQASGEDYKAYCRRRWGGDGWTYSLRDRGQELGLPFGQWDYWPNTLNAHRICTYLEERDQADASLGEKEREQRGLALVAKFYEMTYERGVNISTPEGAAKALDELGFAPADDALRWLKQGGGQDSVAAQDRFAKRDMQISGVPYFVISDGEGQSRPQALSGAHSSRSFLQAMQKVAR